MTDSDPRRLADELEREADGLEQQNEQLGDRVQSVRQDWERKRNDPNVPGAPPAEERGPDSADEPPPEAEFPAKAPSRETE